MKKYYRLILLFLCISCNNIQEQESTEVEAIPGERIDMPGFQRILDEADVAGSVLVYDLQKDMYHSNNFSWAATGHIPASTFKIPNSIIALESGVVENDSTLFEWDGEKRNMKIWEQDLLFREAFHMSCVPCYQDIARRVGVERMREYVDTFAYGNMVFDSASIDMFWLQGDSRISQWEQIDFLQRFYHGKLPISPRTEKIMRRMIIMEENKDYALSGKTGWSIRNGNNKGWFVGFVEKQKKVYFFATHVVPKTSFNMDMFAMIRKDVTFKALEQLGIMK